MLERLGAAFEMADNRQEAVIMMAHGLRVTAGSDAVIGTPENIS